MIRLYNWNETAFTDNGLCFLEPSVCNVHEVAGGQYELYMEHPYDQNERFRLLAEKMIIDAPVPPHTIPEITIPSVEYLKVSTVSDFWQKLPVYKKKTGTAAAIATIRANPSSYLFRPNKYYNAGEYCHDGTSIYQAKTVSFNVLPYSDGTKWGYVAPMDGSSSSVEYTAGVAYSPGLSLDAIVTKIADYSSTFSQIKDAQGRIGYYRTADLTFVQTDEETIPAQYIERQLFRIYRVESDETASNVKVYAKHKSYDFMGNKVMDCKLEEAEPVSAIAIMQGRLMFEDNRRIACNIKSDSSKQYKVSKDWSFRNPVNALLDQDAGLVPLLNAQLRRNNDNFFILSNDYKAGITIEYGVNMLGVNWSRSDETVVSRVVPRCSAGDEEYLYLEHGGTWSDESMTTWVANDDIFVDSPIHDQFPYPKIEVLDCQFAVGEKYTPPGSSTETTRTESSCREEMLKLAQKRFTDDRCDGIDIALLVEFILLGDTEEYKQYKNLQTVNLYDFVTVKTRFYNITAQVTEYEYDCLRKRYESINVGNINNFNKRIPGYRVVNESITYEKLSPDLIRRLRTQNGASGSGEGGTSPGGGTSLVNVPNTKDTDGYVLKGDGNASKVWKTDATGAPGWRTDDAQGIKTKACTFTVSGITAGDIGTRGSSQYKSLSTELGTYTDVLGCYVSSAGGSTNEYIPIAFIDSAKVYLNCYRATDTAINQFSVTVTVVYR